MKKSNGLKFFSTLFILIMLTASLHAQQLAFPTAEGFGKFTTGGRGGVVYYVTDLTDNSTSPTMGSLRYGITKISGARTILFKVSGTIVLQSDLKITNGNITIAGQTAPGDGICLRGYTLRLDASNIIVRYIRSRMGDVTSYIDDAMDANGTSPVVTNSNIIVDHCSMSWSIDETASFYDIKNFTLQWCILSESLYHSVDPKGNHGYAGIWGGQGATFHHNLLAHHSSRNPRFCGSRYTGDSTHEIVDMRNNVIYNWGNINSSYGGEGGNYNMVNNYYKAGPATPGSTTSSNSNKRNRILNYTSYYYSSDAHIYPDTVFGGKFYVSGNYIDGYPDVTTDNWTKGVQPDSYTGVAAMMARNKLSAPISFAPVNTQLAADAYLSVLDNVGAILPKRDTIDRRIVRETRTGTATFEGIGYSTVTGTGITHPSGIIDSQSDVGGWPVLSSTTAPTDTDSDGMPDNWEVANGLNPNNASDRNNINTDGYTMLEVYLNSISQPNSLPVTLVSFKGEQISKKSNSLKWVTSSEYSIKSYIVESSTNGINYSVAATVAANNFAGISNYTHTDTNACNCITYYRLKILDNSGTFTYSSIVVINKMAEARFSSYPNPVKNTLVVTHDPLKVGDKLMVTGIDGKTFFSINSIAAATQTKIDVSTLAAGSYLIIYESGGNKITSRFVKQ